MSLVGELPGFVGLSNLDFRGFQAFAFFIQKNKNDIIKIWTFDRSIKKDVLIEAGYP